MRDVFDGASVPDLRHTDAVQEILVRSSFVDIDTAEAMVAAVLAAALKDVAIVPLPIPAAMVERAQNAFLSARNAVQEAEERRLGAVVTIFNYEWIRAALTAALTPEGA